MDCDKFIAALPSDEAFNAMFPHQRKSIVEDFVGAILDAIPDDGRDPDNWEAHDIAAAIGFIASGWYNAALTAAERALVPPHERAPAEPPFLEPAPTVRALRDGLDYVRGMPARVF